MSPKPLTRWERFAEGVHLVDEIAIVAGFLLTGGGLLISVILNASK